MDRRRNDFSRSSNGVGKRAVATVLGLGQDKGKPTLHDGSAKIEKARQLATPLSQAQSCCQALSFQAAGPVGSPEAGSFLRTSMEPRSPGARPWGMSSEQEAETDED